MEPILDLQLWSDYQFPFLLFEDDINLFIAEELRQGGGQPLMAAHELRGGMIFSGF